MNTPLFIASRLVKSKGRKNSISGPIIKIAISAIAISMLMMVVSIASGIGLQRKIREKIAAFNGHISISNFDENESKVSVNPISTKQTFYPTFTAIPEVTHIQGVATKAGIIRTPKAFEGIVFKGVGTDFKWDNFDEYLVAGRLPKYGSAMSNEVLLSEYLANRLGLKVGSKFVTFFMRDSAATQPFRRSFNVVGIYNSGFKDFDQSYVIGDLKHIQRMNKWSADQVGNFELFVSDFDRLKEIGESVYEEIPSTLNAVTILKSHSFLFEWMALFDFNIMLIIGFMVVVCSINMSVALLVLILEKTKLVGMLKALGAGNWFIRKVFIYQAFFLIGRGLLIGNALGLLAVGLQYYFGLVELNPDSYYVKVAPVFLNVPLILLVNLLTIGVCLLVLVVPSYLITKISPVKAIAYS
ncbi:ABC transporter permease [Flavobacterium aurantiibacter]|uniref:Transmembrane permease n=1 Tax=Flavobacterium aurantiibacter TaxID=2023067 RepID=A0A255ZUF8_9FLAO|nr:FtsX-like permease family protein [Flavobacterium aurantiibacter]OYQ45066.1 transmembrane permease [Flavobacterium aurantiibacter]